MAAAVLAGSGGLLATPVAASSYDRDLSGSQWYLAAVGVDAAWTVTQGQGVTVAVLDAGIDPSHPDLAGALTDVGIVGYTPQAHVLPVADLYDTMGHGTHVSGIIAARRDGHGVTGIAPAATVLPVKMIPDLPGGDEVDVKARLAEVLREANARGARVANMSFGTSMAGTEDVTSHPICQAIASVKDLDMVLVAAAGNEGWSDNMASVPAACPGVISVAAVDSHDQPTFFTTFNADVDIAAPGEHILSTSIADTGRYAYEDGTSMASPVVAGVAALLRSAHPGWTAAQVEERLVATARDAYAPGKDPLTGAGVVDASAALGLPRAMAPGSSLEARAGGDGIRWRSPSLRTAGFVVTHWRPGQPDPVRSLDLPADAVFAPIAPEDGKPGDWVTISTRLEDGRLLSEIVTPWGPDPAESGPAPQPTGLRVDEVTTPEGRRMRVRWTNADNTSAVIALVIKDGKLVDFRTSSTETTPTLMSELVLDGPRDRYGDYVVQLSAVGRSPGVGSLAQEYNAIAPVRWHAQRFGAGAVSVTAVMAPSWVAAHAEGRRVTVAVTSPGGGVKRVQLSTHEVRGKRVATVAVAPGARVHLKGTSRTLDIVVPGH